MDSEDNHIVYTFPRGEGEEVQFAIRRYKNRYYADIRVWFQMEGQNELQPTKKGVFFDLGQFPQVQKGVSELAKAVEKFGRSNPPRMAAVGR